MIPIVRTALVIGALVYFSPVRTFPVALPAPDTVRLPEQQELSRLGQALDAAASSLAATGWLNPVWDMAQRGWADWKAGGARPDGPPNEAAQPAPPRAGGMRGDGR